MDCGVCHSTQSILLIRTHNAFSSQKRWQCDSIVNTSIHMHTEALSHTHTYKRIKMVIEPFANLYSIQYEFTLHKKRFEKPIWIHWRAVSPLYIVYLDINSFLLVSVSGQKLCVHTTYTRDKRMNEQMRKKNTHNKKKKKIHHQQQQQQQNGGTFAREPNARIVRHTQRSTRKYFHYYTHFISYLFTMVFLSAFSLSLSHRLSLSRSVLHAVVCGICTMYTL